MITNDHIIWYLFDDGKNKDDYVVDINVNVQLKSFIINCIYQITQFIGRALFIPSWWTFYLPINKNWIACTIMNSGTNIPKSTFLYVCILTIMWHSWFCKLLQDLFTLCCTVKQGIFFLDFHSAHAKVSYGGCEYDCNRATWEYLIYLTYYYPWLPLLFVDNVILIAILVISIIVVIVPFQLNYSVTFLIWSIGYDQIVFSPQFDKRETGSELWTAVWLFR